LPALEDFIPYLEELWQSRRLTNNGRFHQELEAEMAEFLGVQHVALFANGTLALLTALQALGITGEVITTPYSFVATPHSLWWNNISPVFVDVEADYGNLTPELIEAAITPKTTAIVPVHVYGTPCNVTRVQEIADTHGLKVIYDAAHAFGNTYDGESLLNWGDLSILSFHATKAYNTVEGGAIICHDSATKQRLNYLKNFGFASETMVMAAGINSKMNEIQAALGLLQLKHHQENIARRGKIAARYSEGLSDVPGVSLLAAEPHLGNANYAYFPVFIDAGRYGKSRDSLYSHLKANGIHGRRYFYPLISEFPMYQGLESAQPQNLPIATRMAEQVICLPIYGEMSEETVSAITGLVRDFGEGH